MRKPAKSWIIRLGREAAPLSVFLRLCDDGAASWTCSRSAAASFATRMDAERYGRVILSGDFHAVTASA